MIVCFHSLYIAVRHVFGFSLGTNTEEESALKDRLFESHKHSNLQYENPDHIEQDDEDLRFNSSPSLSSLICVDSSGLGDTSQISVGMADQDQRLNLGRGDTVEACSDQQTTQMAPSFDNYCEARHVNRGFGRGFVESCWTNQQSSLNTSESLHCQGVWLSAPERGIGAGLGRGLLPGTLQPDSANFKGSRLQDATVQGSHGVGRGFIRGIGRGFRGFRFPTTGIDTTPVKQGCHSTAGPQECSSNVRQRHNVGMDPEVPDSGPQLATAGANIYDSQLQYPPEKSKKTTRQLGRPNSHSQTAKSAFSLPASSRLVTSQDGSDTGLGRGSLQNFDRRCSQRGGRPRQHQTVVKKHSEIRAASFPNSGQDQKVYSSCNLDFSKGSDLDIVLTCLQSLENMWLNLKTCPKTEQKQSSSVKQLEKCFSSVANPWQAALHLTRTAKDYVTAKPSSLAYFCMLTFAKWCLKDNSREKTGQQLLTKELKKLAFRTATGKHIAIFDTISSAFQLDSEDKDQFVPDIRQFIADGMIRDACQVISRLGLQEHFTNEEVLIPLFLQDKMNLVEMYLAGCPRIQKEFLSLLDHLCDRNVDVIQFVNAANVNGTRRDKMLKKTISKLAARLLKLYSIPTDACPNITNSRALGALRYLMYKRFIEQGMGHGSWREMVEENVGANEFLQEQLVELLMCSNQNEEALYWADHFSLPDEKLPSAVLELREARSTPSADVQLKALDTEDWDAEVDKCPKSRYYYLKLPEDRISIVTTLDQLEKFYTAIKQPGGVIAFDSEWRPGFIGKQERIALIQVATWDCVYLLDATRLRHILDMAGWQRLAAALFCDDSILTLGYGLVTDLRMLVKSFPSVKEIMHKMKRVVDIAVLAKQVLQPDKTAVQEQVDVANSGQLKGNRSRNEDDVDSSEASVGTQGLSQLVYQCFGQPLCKSDQMSDWERRPLRPDQMIYAALDAYVLLELYDHLCKKAMEKQMDISLEPQLSHRWLNPSRNDRRKAKAANKTQKITRRQPLPKPRKLSPISVRDFRVVVDSSLVGLGYQLRNCGADVQLLENHALHTEVIETSLRENRIALSTGAPFISIQSRVGEHNCYEVQSQGLQEQVLEVLTAFNVYVTEQDIFSRCQVCNSDVYLSLSGEKMKKLYERKQTSDQSLQLSSEPEQNLSVVFTQIGISFETVTLSVNGVAIQVETVPAPKLETVDEFYICCTCGKVFWHGSHFERICNQFESILTARTPPESEAAQINAAGGEVDTENSEESQSVLNSSSAVSVHEDSEQKDDCAKSMTDVSQAPVMDVFDEEYDSDDPYEGFIF